MGTNGSITGELMGLGLKEMVCDVVTFARGEAEKIPIFAEMGNGAIVFMAVPFCKEVDDWLGGFSECDENGVLIDKHEYVAVRTIQPGGSHTIQWKDPNDGHVEPVNCMSYAMKKIAYLSHLVKKFIAKRDFDDQRETFLEENGYSSHKGAGCITVYYRDEMVLRLYIVFSGASEDEDQQCADETAEALVRYLSKLLSDDFSFHMQTVEGYLR